MADHSVLFLARHGQTEWNLVGRRQGQLDSPLTADGRSSAVAVGQLLATSGIDRVFSSPLGRAYETAKLIAGELGLDVEILDDLTEVDHGRIAGLTDAETAEQFGALWAGRRANLYDWTFPGGESYHDGDIRAERALLFVASSGTTRPLLVSHEMTGRMLRGRLLGLSPTDALALSHPHGIVYRVEDGVSMELSVRR